MKDMLIQIHCKGVPLAAQKVTEINTYDAQYSLPPAEDAEPGVKFEAGLLL